MYSSPISSRYVTARAATIRRHLLNVADRVARHARGFTTLSPHWPLQDSWLRLFTAAHPPPA